MATCGIFRSFYTAWEAWVEPRKRYPQKHVLQWPICNVTKKGNKTRRLPASLEITLNMPTCARKNRLAHPNKNALLLQGSPQMHCKRAEARQDLCMQIFKNLQQLQIISPLHQPKPSRWPNWQTPTTLFKCLSDRILCQPTSDPSGVIGPKFAKPSLWTARLCIDKGSHSATKTSLSAAVWFLPNKVPVENKKQRMSSAMSQSKQSSCP